MASQVRAKHSMEQETGFLVDVAGNKLQAISMMKCQMTPFVIPKEGNVDHFAGGKIENIYHAEERDLDFLEEQVKDLKAEKNQSILVSMFRALTGSRCKD